MNSKDPFNAIKSSQIKFRDARNKQNKILNKLNNIKIGRKTIEQEKVNNNIKKFYISREVINFLVTILKCYPMQITRLNKMKLKEQDLKYYHQNKCFNNYQ